MLRTTVLYATRVQLIILLLLAGQAVSAQQPFDLDTTFRTNIDTWYVNSIMPLPDGKIFISGQMKFPGDIGFRGSAKLLPNGERDLTFPSFPQTTGGGPIRRWGEDHMYVGAGHTVRRLTINGLIDTTFRRMNQSPYFSSFQIGDYHVYPDGRILMSGLHMLSDTIRGFTGPHCLVWFSNTGYMDTTQHHRKCAGSLDDLRELPDGKFIGSGSTSTWDGQPASHIIRFHADGSLDPSFQTNVWWGQAHGFLPLEDGRVYATGLFRIVDIPDTFHLVRFMPDGSLDPTFNNTIKFSVNSMNTQPWGGLPRKIFPLDEGRLLVTGSFEEVEGEVRRCIALVDTNGTLVEDHFANAGVGNFTYQGGVGSVTSGIIPTMDGDWYIWGAYHGYNDGTTSDPQQRMISRLHGLHVGVEEKEVPSRLEVFPNPSSDLVQITYDLDPLISKATLVILDANGRKIHRELLSAPMGQITWSSQKVVAGAYTVAIQAGDRQVAARKLIIQR